MQFLISESEVGREVTTVPFTFGSVRYKNDHMKSVILILKRLAALFPYSQTSILR